MITRAQAGALLNLAESLEACERVNLGICPAFDGSQNIQLLDSSVAVANVSGLTATKLRNAVKALVPQGEGK